MLECLLINVIFNHKLPMRAEQLKKVPVPVGGEHSTSNRQSETSMCKCDIRRTGKKKEREMTQVLKVPNKANELEP